MFSQIYPYYIARIQIIGIFLCRFYKSYEDKNTTRKACFRCVECSQATLVRARLICFDMLLMLQ